MTSKIWTIKTNDPLVWNFDGVEIIKCKRELGNFCSNMLSKKIITLSNIPINDDVTLLNTITTKLNVNEESLINTINIYEHPNYLIQCSYRSDLDFTNSKDFNYFSTVINLESINIFGSVIFFKIENNKLIDLEIDELLVLLVNFYYLKTVRLINGVFEEIGISNFEPDLTRLFNGYKIKKYKDWIILSDDSKSNLVNMKEDGNKIQDFNNIIWLRIKQLNGEITQAMKDLKLENNRDGDLRGKYMDIDINYIKSIFFN